MSNLTKWYPHLGSISRFRHPAAALAICLASLGGFGRVAHGQPSPIIKVVPASTSLKMPLGLKKTCMQGPDTLASSATCPVVESHGHTFWALSYIDNRVGMAIVAYDAEGNATKILEHGGARYVWQIALDAAKQTVTFAGQAGGKIVMSWHDLELAVAGSETCSTFSLWPNDFGQQASWTDGRRSYGASVPFGTGGNQLLDEGVEHGAGKAFCDARQQRWFAFAQPTARSPYLPLTCCRPPAPGEPTYNASMNHLLDAAVNDHGLMSSLQRATTADQLIGAARAKGFAITAADIAQSKGGGGVWHGELTKRSVDSRCGNLSESPCSRCTDEVCVYWPFNFCCIKEACTCEATAYSCNGDLAINPSGTCDVKRYGWIETPIDNSRSQASCQNMNCWRYDDSVRDRLEMDTSRLNFVTKLKGVSRLPENGRYIYVYRKSDNNIYIRNYDRNESDKKWMYSGNCRDHTNFGQYDCSPTATGRYLHVRHSQLNGGWDPVWCAGELRIENGKICMANNESGHFKPDQRCLGYVRTTLKDWGVPMADNAIFGDYTKESAGKTCKQLHDEL